MKPKIIYPRLLQLSAAFLLLPLGMNAQTYPIDHIDRPDEVHHVSDKAGSVVYNSANASSGVSPLNPLELDESASEYKWSFSFQIPEGMLNRSVIIRLDDGSGSAEHFIAGIALNSSGQLGYMTNPNVGSLSSQMTYLSTPLTEQVWYDVTFLFTTPMVEENLGIDYVMTISGVTDNEGIAVSYVPSALVEGRGLRHMLSYLTNDGGTNIKVRDVSLQTIAIPEPATLPVLLVVAGILVGLHLRKRNRS